MKAYTLEEIRAAHPVEPKKPAPLPPKTAREKPAAGSRREALVRVVREKAAGRSWAEGDRHASAKATAAHGRKLGLEAGDLAAIVTDLLLAAGKTGREAEDIVKWTLENVTPDPDELERPAPTKKPDTRSPAPSPVTPEEAACARPVLVTLSTVKRERVSWLWPGRVPLGKITLLEGDPGLGKSTLALDLIARATTGRPMPHGAQGTEPASAIVLSAEDGLADTIRPRLEAAEADLSLVHALTAVKMPDGAEVFPTLSANLEQIRAAVVETDARIVLIDPFAAYIGAETNSWKDTDVRRCLAPLAALAEDLGVAVLLVRHLTKGGGSSAIYRGGGSIGIVAAARSALLVAKDPEDEDRRILAPVKSNLCAPPPSIAYRMETLGDVARIAWEAGTVELTAGALLAAQGEDGEDEDGSSLLEEAADFLRDLLQHGAVGTGAVQTDARKAGHSWRTVRRAQKRLGIKPEKTVDGWKWRLPEAQVSATQPLKVAKMAKPSIYGHLGHLDLDGEAENAENAMPERPEPPSGSPVQGGQGSEPGPRPPAPEAQVRETPALRRERLGL